MPTNPEVAVVNEGVVSKEGELGIEMPPAKGSDSDDFNSEVNDAVKGSDDLAAKHKEEREKRLRG